MYRTFCLAGVYKWSPIGCMKVANRVVAEAACLLPVTASCSSRHSPTLFKTIQFVEGAEGTKALATDARKVIRCPRTNTETGVPKGTGVPLTVTEETAHKAALSKDRPKASQSLRLVLLLHLSYYTCRKKFSSL